MDAKLLSKVMASGDTSSRPPPLRATPPKPIASQAPSPSPADGFYPSPETSKAPVVEALEDAIHSLPPFTPYSAQVPWHTGMRALFSQMFPRYGHYCGPNWSSGRSDGSLLWDKPPIDWLDHCCFCHDVGYDSYDQAKLYKADLELLECLQKRHPPKQKEKNEKSLSQASHENINESVAWFYRNLYITGLQNFLLPYRRMLLRDIGEQRPQEQRPQE